MATETEKILKICFIMQRRSVGTHMDYVYEMARTLRHDEGLPLTLFLEKDTVSPEDASWCVAQTFRFAPLRILENFFRLLILRFSGHKVFYIHYSFLSAISAGLITKLFGGTVYYWNCGMPWLYKRSWYTNLYQKLAYRLIDYLVTGVEAIVPRYRELYGLTQEQIKIIPNWIDLDLIRDVDGIRSKKRAELGISKDTKVLLYVHTLAKRKGAHLLPEILKAITDTSVHMIVAGDGDQREYIKTQFTQYGLTDRVHMLGYVARKEVEELYRAADVFVMPSEEEGSPHSLIEAMAYGLPFVSFDVGGVKETAPPSVASFLHVYPDITALATSIDQLLSDKNVYESFVASERVWVHHFSKPKIVNEFKKLLLV